MATAKVAPPEPPYRLTLRDNGCWELQRAPASDETFATWLDRGFSLKLGELTALQRESMRATFERSRDADAALQAVGDEP
jgi:hypothetical protein